MNRRLNDLINLFLFLTTFIIYVMFVLFVFQRFQAALQ